MIVLKRWISVSYENAISGNGKRKVTRRWKGWFLLWFIPLYIENSSTDYTG